MDTQLFDINLKLPIIKSEDGLNGIISVVNNDCNNNKHELDLPKPSFRLAENYEYKKRTHTAKKFNNKQNQKYRDSYFHYKEPSFEELLERVEYDMDDEDIHFLNNINEKFSKLYNYEVTEDDFEKVMDRIDKESHFESQAKGKDSCQPAIDEDAVCSICNDGQCENANVILFCDMCDLPVHQECYGVPYIPEGQWLCRRCLQSPSRNVDCVLCPNKGGAFKQTDDNRWAHVICALWVPEVCFANTVFLEPVDSIDRIPQARWKLCCYICKQKKIGACIQCHKPNCYVPFHVTCAQQAGLYMKIKTCKYETPEGEFKDVKKEAFCDAHGPSDNSGRGGAMYSGDETDEEDLDTKAYKKWKKEKREKMKKTREILAVKRTAAPNPIATPGIKYTKVPEIKALVTVKGKKKPPEQFDKLKDEFVRRMMGIWIHKRNQRNGVPLIRRLQIAYRRSPTVVAELIKEDFKQNQSKYTSMRYDLERARLLVGEVKKRELFKKRLLKYSMEIVELRYRTIDIDDPPLDD